MTNAKYALLFSFFFCLGSSLLGQTFQNPTYTFSKNRLAYFTLIDQSHWKGFVVGIDKSKSLIEAVELELLDGTIMTIHANMVDFMYLPESSFESYMTSDRRLSDMTDLTAKPIAKELISQGYVFFERSTVLGRNDEKVVLLQLLNPTFSDVIKVYHNPRGAHQPVAVADSQLPEDSTPRSFFVKKANGPATRVSIRNYPQAFQTLFGDCPIMSAVPEEEMIWDSFAKHIYDYQLNHVKLEED